MILLMSCKEHRLSDAMVFLPILNACSMGTSSALMMVFVMPCPSGSMAMCVPAKGACVSSVLSGRNSSDPSFLELVSDPGNSTLLPSVYAMERQSYLSGLVAAYIGMFLWMRFLIVSLESPEFCGLALIVWSISCRALGQRSMMGDMAACCMLCGWVCRVGSFSVVVHLGM
jgi:hypothetical protein